MHELALPDFMAVTVGLVAYLIGEAINDRVGILQEWNIPEPVTGGLLMACFFWLLYATGIAAVSFDTHFRDLMLLVFFTGLGLNAQFAELARGGRPLLILAALTAVLLILQNVVGGLGALAFGLPPAMGAMLGSTSLLGGHGTVIAWGPEFAARGVAGAQEVGAAMATLGLVVAGVIGGPLARRLIESNGLVPDPQQTSEPIVGLARGEDSGEPITRSTLMRTLLWIFVCVIGGYLVHGVIRSLGLMLPLFVPCLLVGAVVGNLAALVPRVRTVSRTPALALVSDFALGVFLSISLMSLQLWALAGLGPTLLTVLVVQTALGLAFSYFLIFGMLGRNYQAAVLAAGYSSFAIGATPTAIATMTAVTRRYGPAPVAFIVLPLVSAIFVDIANALVTQGYLALMAP